MKAEFSNQRAALQTLSRVLVVFAVVVVTLAGTTDLQRARGALSWGTLPGTVLGGTGSGTPVPVGTTSGEGGLPQSGKGCVKGFGYWKNHVEAWPVTTLTVGGIVYNQAQLLAIMNNPSADKSYGVARQLIAVMLNVANGMRDAESDAAVVAANDWLVAHPLGSNPGNDAGFSSILVSFNTGATGQIACDDTGIPVTFTYQCQVETNQSNNRCAEGFYSTRYVWDGKKWREDNNSKVCLTQAQCQTPVSNNLRSALPCDPFVTADGLSMICVPRYGVLTARVSANVQTTCPINEVLRAPYPRALVNAETNYFLQPALYNNVTGYDTAPQSPDNLNALVDAQGDPTEAGYAAAVWRNFVLTVRSRRFAGGENWFNQPASLPGWTFWDRSWNNGPDPRTQQGAVAKYTYATSSAGLTSVFGRGYDQISRSPANTYALPAYQVDIETSCAHEWKGYAELAQRTWTKTGACVAGTPLPNPPGGWWHPEGTSGEGCAAGSYATGHYTFYWAPFATTWSGIDMRLTGRATSYDLQNSARGGGQVNGTYYWDDNGGIWVPVVEVQSVLREACVAAGTCAPPVAEPGSLTP
ncbi:MAG: hypothetical protein ABIQ99_07770 [Thermoflexales bacterium]